MFSSKCHFYSILLSFKNNFYYKKTNSNQKYLPTTPSESWLAKKLFELLLGNDFGLLLLKSCLLDAMPSNPPILYFLSCFSRLSLTSIVKYPFNDSKISAIASFVSKLLEYLMNIFYISWWQQSMKKQFPSKFHLPWF